MSGQTSLTLPGEPGVLDGVLGSGNIIEDAVYVPQRPIVPEEAHCTAAPGREEKGSARSRCPGSLSPLDVSRRSGLPYREDGDQE